MAYDPVLAVNDICQLTIRATQFGQFYQTSFYYQVQEVTVPGQGAYSDLNAVFNTNVWTELRPFMSLHVTGVRFRIQKVFPLPKLLFRYFEANPNTGLSAVTPLPPAVSIVLRAYADLAGPEGRGRNFLFGLTADQNAFGQIPPAAIANFRTLAELIYEDDLVGGSYTWQPVLFAPAKAGPPPTVAHVSPIVASDVNIILRQQRRRELGVGE